MDLFWILLVMVAIILVFVLLRGGSSNTSGHDAVDASGKIRFSILDVRTEDVVSFFMDFTAEGPLPVLQKRKHDEAHTEGYSGHQICAKVLRNYDFAIECLRKRLAPNGWAFDDEKHPVRFDIRFRSEDRREYSTSILIYHSNLYGYCFRCMGKWRCFSDSPYALRGEDGKVVSDIAQHSAYCDGCFDNVGVSTIITSLKVLNSDYEDNSIEWKKAVLHMVFCFIEAVRFNDICFLVRSSIMQSFWTHNEVYGYQLRVNGYYQRVVNSWGIICNALTAYEKTNQWKMSEENQTLLLFTGNEVEKVTRAREIIAVRI